MSTNQVVALTEGDGRLLWITHLNAGVTATPAVYKEIVYIGTESGGSGGSHLDARQWALRGNSGQVLWSSLARDSIEAGAAIANGVSYVGISPSDTLGSVIAAYDATTGQQRWTFGSDQSFEAQPAVANGRVYAADRGGNLRSFGLTG